MRAAGVAGNATSRAFSEPKLENNRSPHDATVGQAALQYNANRQHQLEKLQGRYLL